MGSASRWMCPTQLAHSNAAACTVLLYVPACSLCHPPHLRAEAALLHLRIVLLPPDGRHALLRRTSKSGSSTRPALAAQAGQNLPVACSAVKRNASSLAKQDGRTTPTLHAAM